MNKKGISLIELLLAIALSAIIFVIASSIMMGVARSNLNSRRQENFEQVKNDVQNELVNSIKWAKEVTWTTNQITIDGKIIKLEGMKIFRDSDAITPDSVRITKMEIAELGPGDENVSLKVTIEMQNAQIATVKDSFVVVATKRSTEIVE